MLKFNSNNSKESLAKEWLVTNGIGGYASSTISGANTRRYHGLLVASLNPPVQRQVLVSKIEESIIMANGSEISFSSNYFPGVIHPEGFHAIESFQRKPLPTIVFSAKGHRIKKTVFMVYGSNTTVVEYENLGKKNSKLLLNPFYVYRDYHSLYHEEAEFCHYFQLGGNILEVTTCQFDEPVSISFTKGCFTENYIWYKNYQYPEEQKRGQDYMEDAFSIGNIQLKIKPEEKIYLTFSTDKTMVRQSPEKLKQNEISRLEALISNKFKVDFLKDLITAADQFIVVRNSTGGKSMIAGYHWFSDWGRDTMIGLQGFIALGKEDTCKSILTTFLKHVDNGMLPNRFPDNKNDQPEYNTIDATLWLFVALYQYYNKFGDPSFIQHYFPQIEEILTAHIEGTRYNIHVNDKGFLFGGEGISQLTWMDARVGDYVVTPRHGCPVEIQALWYNALKIYLFFCNEFSGFSTDLQSKAEQLSKKLYGNFLPFFLNSEGYLNDVIGLDFKGDETLRPNQLYALSLPFPLVDQKTGKRILETVDSHLLTPFGLRTLSPRNLNFRPVYAGNQWERDLGYHQGAVWPFLLADYFKACIYVYGDSKQVRESMKKTVDTFRRHFYESDCIHGISEIFDGLKPEEGRGTIHQAWSVSALIQIMLRFK